MKEDLNKEASYDEDEIYQNEESVKESEYVDYQEVDKETSKDVNMGIDNSDGDKIQSSTDESRTVNIQKEIFSWIKILVGAFVVAFLLSHFVILNARVPSGSMISTIEKGDKVIGFRLSYLFSDPKRGDIVMFNSPIEDKIYIKRVIAIPGDRIKIQDNVVYINDKAQKEKYVKNGWTNCEGSFDFGQIKNINYAQWKECYNEETQEYTLPKGCYFMMGDNRDQSNDSRYWGYVEEDEILAKAIFRYYPSFSLFK